MSDPVTRRTFLERAALGTAAVARGARHPLSAGRRSADVRFYVGTFTRDGGEGIYHGRLDPRTGALAIDGVTRDVVDPSFLAVAPGGRSLYAVNHVNRLAGEPGGGVSAFALDRRTGALRLLNRERSHGASPCHLTVDPGGRWVLAANYGGGSAAVLPVRADGSLGPAAHVVQHAGAGPHPVRQRGPHPHSVTVDAAGRFACVADLGTDRVMVYRLDAERGRLTPAARPWAQARPGAGPRHFAFAPDGRRAYVINELDSTLAAFAYDPATGTLREVRAVSTLPAGYDAPNTCADVHVAASGRFVYASNRGHDSIAVFAAGLGLDVLTPVQHVPTGGRTPRNFALDPSGRHLLAANQDSHTITVFAVDPATGQLTATGHAARVPAPVCVRFLPPST